MSVRRNSQPNYSVAIGSAGMSLIDVIFAMLITAMGAIAVYMLITGAGTANQRAADEMIAVNSARQEIEILRSVDANLLANRTNAAFIGNVSQLGNLPQSQGLLTISDYAGLTGAKQITAQVIWYSRAGGQSSVQRSVTLTTLMVRGGIGK